MANIYPVINGIAKKQKAAYAVINGVTKKIKKVYGVVDGVTRLIFSEAGGDGIVGIFVQRGHAGAIYRYDVDSGTDSTIGISLACAISGDCQTIVTFPTDFYPDQATSYNVVVYKYDATTKTYTKKSTNDLYSYFSSFLALHDTSLATWAAYRARALISYDGSKILFVAQNASAVSQLTESPATYEEQVWHGHLMCNISSGSNITPTTNSVVVKGTYQNSSQPCTSDVFYMCANDDLSVYRTTMRITYDAGSSYGYLTSFWENINGVTYQGTSSSDYYITPDGKYLVFQSGKTITVYLISGTTKTLIGTATTSSAISTTVNYDYGYATGIRGSYDADTERLALYDWGASTSPVIYTFQLSESSVTLLGSFTRDGTWYISSIDKCFEHMVTVEKYNGATKLYHHLYELSIDTNSVITGVTYKAQIISNFNPTSADTRRHVHWIYE